MKNGLIHKNRKRKRLLTLFYITILFIVLSFLFHMFFREPYPSVNMPAFTSSGVENGIVPAVSYYGRFFYSDSLTWEGDVDKLFPEIEGPRYISTMRYLFFGDSGTRTTEGERLRKKMFVKLTGSAHFYEKIYSFSYPEPPRNHFDKVSGLICKRKPGNGIVFDRFEISEVQKHYRLIDGKTVSEVILRDVEFNLTEPCR